MGKKELKAKIKKIEEKFRKDSSSSPDDFDKYCLMVNNHSLMVGSLGKRTRLHNSWNNKIIKGILMENFAIPGYLTELQSVPFMVVSNEKGSIKNESNFKVTREFEYPPRKQEDGTLDICINERTNSSIPGFDGSLPRAQTNIYRWYLAKLENLDERIGSSDFSYYITREGIKEISDHFIFGDEIIKFIEKESSKKDFINSGFAFYNNFLPFLRLVNPGVSNNQEGKMDLSSNHEYLTLISLDEDSKNIKELNYLLDYTFYKLTKHRLLRYIEAKEFRDLLLDGKKANGELPSVGMWINGRNYKLLTNINGNHRELLISCEVPKKLRNEFPYECLLNRCASLTYKGNCRRGRNRCDYDNLRVEEKKQVAVIN